MATETRTIKEVGKAGEASISPRASRMRTALKCAGRVFASALLVSGLVLASPQARAEEAKAPQKAGIGVKVGAGYNYKDKEPRAIAIVNASVPLPLKLTLSGSAGVSSSTNGSAKWEETNLNLDVPIYGPLFIDLYGYNSRHFGIPTLSAGGDAGVVIPIGAVFAGYEHLFDFGTDIAFGAVKVDAIQKLLALKLSGSYVPATESGAVGAGVTVSPGGWVPELGIHTFVCFNSKMISFADTVATLGWSF